MIEAKTQKFLKKTTTPYVSDIKLVEEIVMKSVMFPTAVPLFDVVVQFRLKDSKE